MILSSSGKYVPPHIRLINERISFIKSTQIFKTVLEPLNINLDDYKEEKFDEVKTRVFLKNIEDIKHLNILKKIIKLYNIYFNKNSDPIKNLTEIGYIDITQKHHKDGEIYLTLEYEKFRNEKEEEIKTIQNEIEKNKIKKEIENKRKEVLLSLFRQRFKEIEICRKKILPSNNQKYNNLKLSAFLESEYEKQKSIFENNLNINKKLNNIFREIIFSYTNTKKGDCNPPYNSGINNNNFNYLIENYINQQYKINNENNRICLLGSILLKEKYKFCEKYFLNIEPITPLQILKTNNKNNNKNKCIDSKFVFWTMMMNTLFLLYIANNKNMDISGLILLPPEMYKDLDISKYNDATTEKYKNCHIVSKKRSATDSSSIKNYKFIGYIVIPYKRNVTRSHYKSKLNELYIFIFEDNDGIYLFDYENTEIGKNGDVFPSFTILVTEIKALYKYLKVNFYYDKNMPEYILLSSKPYEELIEKYNNLIQLRFTDLQNDVHLMKKTHNKIHKNQILLYYVDDKENQVNILQSIDKSDIPFKVPPKKLIVSNNIEPEVKKNNNQTQEKPKDTLNSLVEPTIMSAGSNKILCYDKIEKINKYMKEILKRYFLNNRNEYKIFISNNYLLSKYQYPFIKTYEVTNSKIFLITKNNKKNITIDFNKLLDNDKTAYVYKYYPYTMGYYRSYEIVYNDILNFKNKTIAEISTLPSFFEVFKKILNRKIDLYLSDRNYFCMDKKKWGELISIYKSKISDNILYNKNINKKYDILFVNLLLYVKDEYIPKDVSISPSHYLLKYIDEEVYNTNKEEIKYLKYLKKDGSLYIYFYSIINKKSLDLYILLGKNFENIDFFIEKYTEHSYPYGGLWLKCYNYKSKKRLSKSDLIKKYENFYNKYYNNKYKWFETFEKFIIEYQNSSEKNIDNLKKKVLNKQLLYLKNMSNDFNIELNPTWEKFIYINFFLVNAFKSINYRYNSSDDYQNLFRTFSTEYSYEKYQIIKNQTNIYLNYSIIKKYIFSIIEFLLLVREKYNLKDILVIFTSNQKYISIILKLFPNLNYTILNKKGVTTIKKNKNIKYKILISDIDNLTIQKNLVKKLNLIGYMLNVNKILNVKNKVIKYFNGELYFHNNINLINIKSNKNDKFKTIEYDILDYKSQFNYFRVIDEYNKYKYKDSDLLKYNILGYDDSYYCATEYYIIDKYYNEKENYKKIVETIFELNNQIIFESKNDLLMIDISTILKNKKIKTNINDLFIKILFSLKNQYNYFNKGNILPKIEYLNMKNKINTIYEKINVYAIDQKFSKNKKLKGIIEITHKLYNILSGYDYRSYDISLYDKQYQKIYKKYTELLN